jgi:hypothetical protein
LIPYRGPSQAVRESGPRLILSPLPFSPLPDPWLRHDLPFSGVHRGDILPERLRGQEDADSGHEAGKRDVGGVVEVVGDVDNEEKARKITITTLVSSAQKNGKVTRAPISEPAR